MFGVASLLRTFDRWSAGPKTLQTVLPYAHSLNGRNRRRCRGAYASAQSRSRAFGARRDPGSQRRVQPRGAGHRQRRLLSRRAPAHLRPDGRAQRAPRRDRFRHAEGGARRAPASSTKSAARPTSRRWPTACRARPTSSTTRASSRRRATLRNLIYAANKILTNAYEARPGIRPDPRRGRVGDLRRRRRSAEGRLRADARSGEGELPEDRAAVRAEAPDHRRADRLRRSRRDDARAAGRRPDHRRGAAVDGEDQPGAQHRPVRGRRSPITRSASSAWKCRRSRCSSAC